jgi:hypothetical protein
MTMTDNDYVERNRLRRTPLLWSDLQSIIMSSHVDDLSKLARSEEQSKTYQRWRNAIKDEWESIHDYILCKKIGFEWVWDDLDAHVDIDSNGGYHSNNTNKRKRAVKPLPPSQQHKLVDVGGLRESQLKLCINDFPYYFAPGIQHWVLWKLGGRVTSDEIFRAKINIWNGFNDEGSTKRNDFEESGTVERIVKDPQLFLHWENPPQLQSLPGIDHVHIVFSGELSLTPER